MKAVLRPIKIFRLSVCGDSCGIIDICEIYTHAQPTLKSEANRAYQKTSRPVLLDPMHMKHYSQIKPNATATIIVPNIYHGLRFPIGLSYLSEYNPTNGVIIPSVIYPANNTPPAAALPISSTSVK